MGDPHKSMLLSWVLPVLGLCTASVFSLFALRDRKVQSAKDNKPQPVTAENWRALLLVDGDCALCNGFVQFVIMFNAANDVRFATQQSPLGQRLLRQHNLPMDLSTMIMMERETPKG